MKTIAQQLHQDARRARSLTQIAELGRAARIQQLPITACPFKSWENGYRAWRRGWLQEDAQPIAIEESDVPF